MIDTVITIVLLTGVIVWSVVLVAIMVFVFTILFGAK